MAAHFDRATELKQFDETKGGVKGLLDVGLNQIPRIFIHPPETLSDLKPTPNSPSSAIATPTIDLAGLRPSIIDQIRNAASTFGFFQIINHGVPQKVLDEILDSVKAFHEQPTEAKSPYYRRDDGTGGVSYFSNIDLFKAKAAGWVDTIQIGLGSATAENIPAFCTSAVEKNIPASCRAAVDKWATETERLRLVLEEVLGEGLGLKSKAAFGEGRVMVGHYYPYCPQPDLTVGIKSHTDLGAFTVLLQDHIGGLQIRHGGEWVDVKPVAGALVINIGDFLQIISNDVYKSVEHRVLANGKSEPRVSIAVFSHPRIRDKLYGPLPELISQDTPAIYRQFTYDDYITKFFDKELVGKSLPNHYRI